MYDLLLQESMWNAMALEEGKRSSSVLQVAVSYDHGPAVLTSHEFGRNAESQAPPQTD